MNVIGKRVTLFSQVLTVVRDGSRADGRPACHVVLASEQDGTEFYVFTDVVAALPETLRREQWTTDGRKVTA